jgi:hypothetical protein
MAFIVADRVQETSTTTGTGNFTLAGAATGFQAFASVLSTSDTTYYTIADQGGANWEVGLGTFTSPSTLARTTILSSSNAGSAVNFAAGTKNVFITYPAGRSVIKDASSVIVSPTVSGVVVNDGYTEETVTANTTTAYTISLVGGTFQILTLTGNCTFTFPTATAGQSFMMFLKQDATGSRTVTWPAVVKWPSSTAPTITATASKGDKFVFTADGTNWLGSVAGQNYL